MNERDKSNRLEHVNNLIFSPGPMKAQHYPTPKTESRSWTPKHNRLPFLSCQSSAAILEWHEVSSFLDWTKITTIKIGVLPFIMIKSNLTLNKIIKVSQTEPETDCQQNYAKKYEIRSNVHFLSTYFSKRRACVRFKIQHIVLQHSIKDLFIRFEWQKTNLPPGLHMNPYRYKSTLDD